MRPVFKQLDVVQDIPDIGDPSPVCGVCIDHTLQLSGTLVGTNLRVEVSNDRSTWVELAQLTAAGITSYPGRSFKWIRIRTAAVSNGDTPVVVYGGRDVRTDEG